MVQNSATFARTADLRARQARRKELKRLLREVLPHNLPEVLIPKILTWVGYDLIEDKPIKPLRHSTRNRDPVYTGQKTIGGAPSKRSAPLVRVGNTAEKMAGNIGDDLLKGVSGGGGDGCGPKIKEMQDLKCAFEGLVNERKRLKGTKKQAGAQHPPNPFFSVPLGITASATSPAPWQTQPPSAAAEREQPTAPAEREPPTAPDECVLLVPPMATGEKTTLVDQEQPEPETPSVRSGCPLKVWM